MGAAPSIPPPPFAPERTLRAGTLPRSLMRSPRRYSARRRFAEALDRACAVAQVSDKTLADSMGLRADREGAEARSGALPITAGEAILLGPDHVGEHAALELLIEKRSRDRAAGAPPIRLTPEERAYVRELLLDDALGA